MEKKVHFCCSQCSLQLLTQINNIHLPKDDTNEEGSHDSGTNTNDMIYTSDMLESYEQSRSVFEDLIKVRQDHPSKFVISHLNINSLKTKFIEITGLLVDKIADFLIIAETKIDGSFRNSLFEVSGYKIELRDVHGGDIATVIRSDIPA